jgi:hypothetical protein
MQQIAVGLGDEYTDTRAVTGVIPRYKKDDGLLTLNDGDAHVVLEMTDSVRAKWTDYLDEAERHREATASLGLVRELSQNEGQSIRVLGSRRIVMVFDPANDDASPAAHRRPTAESRGNHSQLAARLRGTRARRGADHRGASNAQEGQRDPQASASIRKNADTIDRECNAVQTGVDRLPSQALDALAGVAIEVADLRVSEPASGSSSGAA